VHGTPLQVTVVATDEVSVDWIEWEAAPVRSDPAAEDPVLVTVRRFDCDGGPICTNTWTVTPTGHGRYVVVAQARDKTVQGSNATADLTVR